MVIGLTGKKQAGKNAVATMLAAYSPLPVVEISFAAKLKQSAAALLGCEVADLEEWKNDPEAMVQVTLGGELRAWDSIRMFLQRYGTEAHRDVFGADFWLDAALPLRDAHDFTPWGSPEPTKRFVNPAYNDALYVVTDVRFPNEAQRVKDVGGYVVQVIGPAEVEQAGDGHPSEAPLHPDLVDLHLPNDRRDDNFAHLDRGVRQLLMLLNTAVPA